jgi:hypothetical protein
MMILRAIMLSKRLIAAPAAYHNLGYAKPG